MKRFEVNGKEYGVCDSWDDVTLEKWIEFFQFQESHEGREIDDIYMIELFELMSDCDCVLDMEMTQLNELVNSVTFLTETPKLSDSKSIIIDGKLYGSVDFNKMTAGEYISIKTLMGSEKNVILGIPKLLSIIVRPAEEIVNEETGEKRLKIEKFSVENLEWRAEKFKSVKVVDVLHWVNFFLTGKNQSSTITKPSTQKKEQKETHGHLQSQNNSIG